MTLRNRTSVVVSRVATLAASLIGAGSLLNASARAQVYTYRPGAPVGGQFTPIQETGQASVDLSVFIPDTSIERPGDIGVRAHTNHQILLSSTSMVSGNVATLYGGLGPGAGLTPAQVRSFYNITANGSGTIAIVAAYHYATAVNDFNVFSQRFGLPLENGTGKALQVVFANGKQPTVNGGWAQEAAMDIEWAHAMAPNARIVLVEAASSNFSDLFVAVTKARTLGASQISMSWGGSEFSGERSYDSYFSSGASGTVFFAASGDTGGVMSYPAASPSVVAVGGTKVTTSASGSFVSETAWSSTGGGVSAYEPRPAYQFNLGLSGRGVPDISSVADPSTGVCVYVSTASAGRSGWLVFGGTSVAAPTMAGMVNAAGHNGRSTADELSWIYQNAGGSYYRDIVAGTAGKFSAARGWDKLTGVGSPLGFGGI